MRKSRLLAAIVMICMMTMLLAGCGEKTTTTSDKGTNKYTSKESDETQAPAKEATDQASGDYLSGKHHVNIVIKDKGTISVELDADVAPITVTNFVNLAKDGFYDGVVFHRIIEDFMMQGGDPTGTGGGGSGKTIKGEFAANGVEINPRKPFRRGADPPNFCGDSRGGGLRRTARRLPVAPRPLPRRWRPGSPDPAAGGPFPPH